MTTEKKVAQTVLQDKETLVIAGKKYEVAPPTTATLIRVSEFVSQLPEITNNENKIIQEGIKQAKYWGVICKSMAIMILGEKKYCFWKKWRHQYRLMKLEKAIASMEVEEMIDMYLMLLSKMKVDVFFSLIIFLKGNNLTKPTRTTASGV